MTVYAVFKVGVYRHECAGVFSTSHRARTVADHCASLGDGRHCFEVVPFEIDALPVLTENPETYGEADEITEPDSIYEAHYAARDRGRYDEIKK